MLRSLLNFSLLFLLLGATLFAQESNKALKEADRKAKSLKKTDQFRAYNSYKNLYLQAIMDGDKALKIASLRGIVKTGHALHIDVSRYEKELRHYAKSKSHTTTHSSAKKRKEQKKRVTLQSSHKLQSARWKNGKLVLRFDKPLSNKQINYFTLYDKKKKRYKYVFDIHASMLTRSKSLRKRGVDRIKIAQYKPRTLRLVIENRKKLLIRFKKASKSLIIRIETASKKKKKATPTKVVQYNPRSNKVIVIDAGHGGKDPGALGYRRYREKVVVLQIARELQKILKSRGYKVYMTRSRDKFIRLRNRTKYANDKKADIFISLHANAVPKKDAKSVHGIECYFLAKSRSNRAKKVAAMENSADLEDMNFYGKQCFLNTINSHNIVAANKLAIDLQRGALASLQKKYKNVKDAGVREGPFWVLVGAQMPAVLVEVGFITHPMEAKRLANRKYQHTMAEGLANGIERYFINN